MAEERRSATAVARAQGQLRRAAAEEAERIFTEALYAGRRGDIGRGRIKAPPTLERRAERFGGGYRSRSDDYDWFYELSKEEQARIRQNWMTHDPGAVTPDEIEGMGLPIGEWLALTRGIDASRAVQTGRHLQAKRYGGRDPLAYLEKGRPEDYGEPVREFRSRRDDHPNHYVTPTSKVQFFTDKNGVVHPIRASYEQRGEAATPEAPRRFIDAYGKTREFVPSYDPDEAF